MYKSAMTNKYHIPDDLWLTQATCGVCKKEFYKTPLWSYFKYDNKGRKRYFCSYSCSSKYNKEHEKKRKVDTAEAIA